VIYCGIAWAERTHDVALVDDAGVLLAKRHITDDAAGYTLLLQLLAEQGDFGKDPIPVAIETSRGLLVAVLRTGKRQVFAINPMAAARYRDRHSVSRKKSDPGDALCRRTSCARTCTPTGPCRRTVPWPEPTPSWPAPRRTPPGTVSRSPTSRAPCCASTARPPWKPSRPGPTAYADPKPASCSRPPRHPPGLRG